MIPALINLIVVLLVAAVLYWALGKLWPLTGAFGSRSAAASGAFSTEHLPRMLVA